MKAMDDHEFYETPETFSHYLFREIPITGTVFEPCVGSGAILRAAHAVPSEQPRQWLTNDYDERWPADWHHDAANEHLWRNVITPNAQIDWTVSNTAFTPAIDIATLALKYSKVGVALLLRATIHEVLKTGIRRTWMADNPPTGILWLPRFGFQRSKATKKWSTDSACCCWLIWQKGAPGQFIRYAPGWVLDALDDETPAYRARMDALMETRQPMLLG